jgi:hypothetical protein
MMQDGCYAVIDSYNTLLSVIGQSGPNVGELGVLWFSEQSDSSICAFPYRKEILVFVYVSYASNGNYIIG